MTGSFGNQTVGTSSGYIASTFEFRLNAPLTEAESQTFEEQRIRLPDDYRAFLQYAGNGGGH